SVPFRYTPTPHPPLSSPSLHDALPISCSLGFGSAEDGPERPPPQILVHSRSRIVKLDHDVGWLLIFSGQPEKPGGNGQFPSVRQDRKSTRLNSSHLGISYAVFCLKKKI